MFEMSRMSCIVFWDIHRISLDFFHITNSREAVDCDVAGAFFCAASRSWLDLWF